MTYEVITLGRCGVDVYPEQVGVGLEDVATFAKFLGGSPTNVAVAASRLGHRSAVITKTGDDPFGRFVRRALEGFGVDTAFVGTDPDLPTPVTFCEIFPPDDFPLYFYRRPSAPDLQLRAEELAPSTDLYRSVQEADILWFTVTGLSEEPSREAHLAALEARGKDRLTVIDLDYRPMFWSDPADATAAIAEVLPYVSVAVGNREECEVAIGETEPQAAAKALRAAGVETAIVKQGPAGVLGVRGDESVVVPPVPVDVVNGLGAGDAFGGSLVHGLLSGWNLERTLRFANAAGAYVAGQLSCADAMPTPDVVEQVLSNGKVVA
ncbi:5-dehydro-2-deoxygluconokinase [Aeromicrobium sp. SORGH_AS981]|uniref:5-dehydro-2-deoxygluconokinase n=1 Tax=Aeromicrobium sp. SORGH_AS_0981 TaxID=3041802 RepID=UPI00285AA028|nr:5-dehydro-2-deoxygluconokinase [Aeromicrobium sp. SORGH_AS_0981]MDR6118876.1 5-dehydro-2-deoxygluconokinase [Aeromicrobium sp. SORGH_AS_0981]